MEGCLRLLVFSTTYEKAPASAGASCGFVLFAIESQAT